MTRAVSDRTPDRDGLPDMPWHGAIGSRREPDIYEVARGAGVSHQTVSRVLNGHPHVSHGTKDRVQASINRLNYRRNSMAIALATGRSSTLGLLIDPDLFLSRGNFTTAAIQAAQNAGYTVMMRSLHGDHRLALAAGLAELCAHAVAGMIVVADGRYQHLLGPLEAEVPVVMASSDRLLSRSHTVCVDNVAGARLAVRHLVGLGHRRIAHISGPPHSADAAARQQGWQQELAHTGHRPREVIPGDWTPQSGYAAGQSWVDSRDQVDLDLPTAVFAANDLMALGLIRALHDRAVRVPEDVSVIGFDNMPGTAHLIPGLTTVENDLSSVGEECVRALVRLICGRPSTVDLIDPHLVIRTSTAHCNSGSDEWVSGRP